MSITPAVSPPNQGAFVLALSHWSSLLRSWRNAANQGTPEPRADHPSALAHQMASTDGASDERGCSRM